MAKELTMNTPPHSLKVWIQVFRPFSYTASLIPVLLGAALAVFLDRSAQWILLPLIVIASVAVQAGTNLVSEYYDLKKGVDRPDTYGSSRVLVEKLLCPKDVLMAGLACFAVTIGIGLVFIAVHGWPILLLGLVGVLGGYFYTAGPLAYKYTGIGDLAVFVLMGPLMVIGSFFVLTGTYFHSVLWASLPVGCLTAAILSGNNLRDIKFDRQAHIHTTASVLGHRRARWEYASLVIGAFAVTLGLVVFGILPLWSLLTFVTLPPAIKNVKAALVNRPDNPEEIAMLDVQTAQQHMPFGLLLIVSLLIEGLF